MTSNPQYWLSFPPSGEGVLTGARVAFKIVDRGIETLTIELLHDEPGMGRHCELALLPKKGTRFTLVDRHFTLRGNEQPTQERLSDILERGEDAIRYTEVSYVGVDGKLQRSVFQADFYARHQ